MSYKLTFSTADVGVEVNGNMLTDSPYILKSDDRIIINGNANVIVNDISYSKDTTLEIKAQDINIKQSGDGYAVSIIINFLDIDKIVSTNMLSHFKNKLFEQSS